MVGFSVKAKWKSGWRNIHAVDDRNEAFRQYWQTIHARLDTVDRPLARAAPDPSPGSSFFRRILSSSPFVMAPMVVLSERAFRVLCRRYGVGLCFGPMVTEQRVLNGDCPYAEELLVPCSEDRPLIAQVAGCDPARVLAAAQRLASGGNLCGVDLNLGCPQACARDSSYGVFLAQRDPDRAVAIVRLLAAELGLPVSAKIRVVHGGVDGTVTFAKRLEEAGASMLTLHGRRPEQRDHQGPSDLDAVKAVREAVRIPVLANGNCRTRRDAEAALAYTGADGVMSAVGLLRQPRLFALDDDNTDAVRLTPAGTLADPALGFEIALEYLALAKRYPPPELRCVRDHWQTLLQGLVQWQLPAVWSLLGNDLMTTTEQYTELIRLAASLYGELEAVDAAVATGAAMEKLQERWPVLSLAEIKRMNRPTEEDGDDADGADAGLGFGLFDEEEGEEEEAEGGEEEACWLEYALEVQAPWSRRLLDGTKTIETRGYSLPTVVMDAPVLLIESPGDGGLAAHGLGAGRAVGVVVFGRCIHYVTKEEWAADAARHGVDPAAAPGAFGWSDEEGKWGWKVSRVEAWPPERCKPVMLREDQRLHRSLFRLGVP